MEIQQGSIVRALVPDPRGFNSKERPVLIITATDEILLDNVILGLAITTSFGDPIPDNMIPIPWASKGPVRTGLRKRSAVVCNWAVELQISNVISLEGFLPLEDLQKVIALRSSLAKQ